MREDGVTMIQRFINRVRWWKWLLWDSPDVAQLVIEGVDKQSRDIIYRRHAEKEPLR